VGVAHLTRGGTPCSWTLYRSYWSPIVSRRVANHDFALPHLSGEEGLSDFSDYVAVFSFALIHHRDPQTPLTHNSAGPAGLVTQTNWIRRNRGGGLSWVGCLPEHCLARVLNTVILATAQFHWDKICTGTRKAIVEFHVWWALENAQKNPFRQ